MPNNNDELFLLCDLLSEIKQVVNFYYLYEKPLEEIESLYRKYSKKYEELLVINA